MTLLLVNTLPAFLATDGRLYRVAAIRTGADTFAAARGSSDPDVFLASVNKRTGDDYVNGSGVWMGLDTLRQHADSDGAAYPLLWLGMTNTRAIVRGVDALATTAPTAALCGYGCGNALEEDASCPAACGLLGRPTVSLVHAETVNDALATAPAYSSAPVTRAEDLAVAADTVAAAIVDGDAGGTYGVPTGDASHRYVVGGYGDAVVLRKGHEDSGVIVRPTVRRFIETNVLLQVDGYGIGFWRDANGRVWLDVVSTYANAGLAGLAARQNGELAVWDSVALREVPTADLEPSHRCSYCGDNLHRVIDGTDEFWADSDGYAGCSHRAAPNVPHRAYAL